MMVFKNPYMGTSKKITLLQQWVLVHCILYYEIDDPIVEDDRYTAVALQLQKMQEEFPEDAMRSRYWYAFEDFDASTGCYLYKSLETEDQNRLFLIASDLSRRFGSKKNERKRSV